MRRYRQLWLTSLPFVPFLRHFYFRQTENKQAMLICVHLFVMIVCTKSVCVPTLGLPAFSGIPAKYISTREYCIPQGFWHSQGFPNKRCYSPLYCLHYCVSCWVAQFECQV